MSCPADQCDRRRNTAFDRQISKSTRVPCARRERRTGRQTKPRRFRQRLAVAVPNKVPASKRKPNRCAFANDLESPDRDFDRCRVKNIAKSEICGSERGPIHRPGRGHAIAKIAVAPAVLNGRADTGMKHAQPRRHFKTRPKFRLLQCVRPLGPCPARDRMPRDLSARSIFRRRYSQEKPVAGRDQTF